MVTVLRRGRGGGEQREERQPAGSSGGGLHSCGVMQCMRGACCKVFKHWVACEAAEQCIYLCKIQRSPGGSGRASAAGTGGRRVRCGHRLRQASSLPAASTACELHIAWPAQQQLCPSSSVRKVRTARCHAEQAKQRWWRRRRQQQKLPCCSLTHACIAAGVGVREAHIGGGLQEGPAAVWTCQFCGHCMPRLRCIQDWLGCTVLCRHCIAHHQAQAARLTSQKNDKCQQQ